MSPEQIYHCDTCGGTNMSESTMCSCDQETIDPAKLSPATIAAAPTRVWGREPEAKLRP
jgi:hypothetical protein